MPKRTTHDIQIAMQFADDRVRRDEEILGKLRHVVRSNLRPSRLMGQVGSGQTLYPRYRGNGFPLRKANGRRLPGWKHLSPWMRVQVALLVLAEGKYRQFKIQLHDDLRLEIENKGGDQREYIRDRLQRVLRVWFGADTPMFFFVIEDMDDAGNPVRPHGHGSIEIPPLPVERVTDKRSLGHIRRIEAKRGKAVAELEAGRWAVRAALRAAAGLSKRRGKVASTGVSQIRNVWLAQPTLPLFNQHWVTYAFKNVGEYSPVLSDNRLALPYNLRSEAKQLWAIIRGQ